MKWLRKAADRGYALAQHSLGGMYDNGQGVAQDYQRGEGVAQDYALAAAWYRKAADQGLARAQHNLGLLYQKGEGAPQDFVLARMWFELAAAQGRQQAITDRDATTPDMTPAQISEAQRLARDWKPKQ